MRCLKMPPPIYRQNCTDRDAPMRSTVPPLTTTENNNRVFQIMAAIFIDLRLIRVSRSRRQCRSHGVSLSWTNGREPTDRQHFRLGPYRICRPRKRRCGRRKTRWCEPMCNLRRQRTAIDHSQLVGQRINKPTPPSHSSNASSLNRWEIAQQHTRTLGHTHTRRHTGAHTITVKTKQE